MILKNKFILIFLLLAQLTWAQRSDFKYYRPIEGQPEGWKTIRLPDEIYHSIAQNFNDIRIIGYTQESDSFEAPYLQRSLNDRIVNTIIPFTLINETHTENAYFYTFEADASQSINQIDLNLGQQNFDWQVTLEGSLNQQDWFVLLDDYRILSIQTDIAHFYFTKLSFPNAKFRYYRMAINTSEDPQFEKAQLSDNQVIKGINKAYEIKKLTRIETKENNSEIDLYLAHKVPVNTILLKLNREMDYYRNLTIQSVYDSVETPKGLLYHYNTVFTGTLNSLEPNIFHTETVWAKHLRLIIANDNNLPLAIDSINVKGFVNELVVQFPKKASYKLFYGNPLAKTPIYDLVRFQDKIPVSIAAISLGEEVTIPKQAIPTIEPLFNDSRWLWGIMLLIIGLLAYFTFKMMKNR